MKTKTTMTTRQIIEAIEHGYKASHAITGTTCCQFTAFVRGAWRTVFVNATTVTVGGVGQIAGDTMVAALQAVLADEYFALA